MDQLCQTRCQTRGASTGEDAFIHRLIDERDGLGENLRCFLFTDSLDGSFNTGPMSRVASMTRHILALAFQSRVVAPLAQLFSCPFVRHVMPPQKWRSAATMRVMELST